MPTPASVLVVEDDVSTQNLLVAVVKHLGLQARTAGGGAAALEFLAAMTPDAILLDLVMPEVDGFAVLRWMKQTAPALLGRTIVVTAAAIRDPEEGADLGLVRAFLRKPLDIDQLGISVLECVGRHARKIGRDGAYETPSQP